MEGTILEIITEKLSPNKINSFWYHGDSIARIQFPNGKKLYAESAGELEVFIDGDLFIGDNAVVEATKRGYTDVDIEQLGSNDAFRCNNWFVIIMVDVNGEVCSDDLAIGDDYNHAMELLNTVAEEQFELMYQ
jgi:hypothetical protein